MAKFGADNSVSFRGSHKEWSVAFLKQWKLLFLELLPGGFHPLAYRFAVETDVDGSALAVKFAGLRGETAVLNWNVPLGLDAFTGGIGMPATESVELDAPSVGVRDRKTKTGE